MKSLIVEPCRDPSLIQNLTVFCHLLLSCYGPRGAVKVIQTPAGFTMWTSSSSRLAQFLDVDSPVLKMTLTTVRNQLAVWGDFGLFTGSLCSLLLQALFRLDIPRTVVAKIYDYIYQLLGDILIVSPSIQMDWESVRMMVKLVRSILVSKSSSCRMDDGEQKELSLHIVQAFLQSLPTEPDSSGRYKLGDIHVCVEDSARIASSVYKGVLIREPDLSLDVMKKINQIHNSKILVALLTGPLEFDEDSGQQLEVDLDASPSLQYARECVQRLKEALERGVRIVACQKTVATEIKLELKQMGMLLLDRLGTVKANSLASLCGCVPIADLSLGVPEECLGVADGVHHVVRAGHSYIAVTGSAHPVVCLLVGDPDEHHIEELKLVCKTAVDTLRSLLSDGRLTCGGGCLETLVAHKLFQKVCSDVEDLAFTCGCSKAQVMTVSRTVCDALHRVAAALPGREFSHTDNLYHHLWTSESSETMTAELCSCGGVSRGTVENMDGDWTLLLPNSVNLSFNEPVSSLTQQRQNSLNSQDIYMPCKSSVNNYVPFSLSKNPGVVRNVTSYYPPSQPFSPRQSVSSSNGHQYHGLQPTTSAASENTPSAASTLLPNTPEILDCFSAKCSAYRMALETCSALLHVGLCIFDKAK